MGLQLMQALLQSLILVPQVSLSSVIQTILSQVLNLHQLRFYFLLQHLNRVLVILNISLQVA